MLSALSWQRTASLNLALLATLQELDHLRSCVAETEAQLAVVEDLIDTAELDRAELKSEASRLEFGPYCAALEDVNRVRDTLGMPKLSSLQQQRDEKARRLLQQRVLRATTLQ